VATVSLSNDQLKKIGKSVSFQGARLIKRWLDGANSGDGELVMETLIEHDGIDVWALISARFRPITGALRRVFGCWHQQLSLPFTRENETYRTCLICGARRRFDLERWAMVGDFYRPR
jgi:hypothetical protein